MTDPEPKELRTVEALFRELRPYAFSIAYRMLGAVSMTEEPAAADSLSMAFLVLLESLSPVERALFVLREVLEHEYAQIAAMVGKSEDNCRQLATRARQKVTERRPRFESSKERRWWRQGQRVPAADLRARPRGAPVGRRSVATPRDASSTCSCSTFSTMERSTPCAPSSIRRSLGTSARCRSSPGA